MEFYCCWIKKINKKNPIQLIEQPFKKKQQKKTLSSRWCRFGRVLRQDLTCRCWSRTRWAGAWGTCEAPDWSKQSLLHTHWYLLHWCSALIGPHQAPQDTEAPRKSGASSSQTERQYQSVLADAGAGPVSRHWLAIDFRWLMAGWKGEWMDYRSLIILSYLFTFA